MLSVLRMNRPISIFLVLVFCVTVFFRTVAGEAQSTVPDDEESQLQDETEWDKDLDAKLDATIKILSIIKEELQEDKTQKKPSKRAATAITPGKPGQQAVEEERDWVEAFQKIVGKISRVWRKIRKEVKTTPPGQAKKTDEAQERDTEITKELKTKLDKSIKAMQVIMKELEKIEKEGKEQE